MIIGICSDTHNNRANTLAALEVFKARGARRLLHAGDLTAPSIVELFAGWDVVFAVGNLDGKRDELALAARAIGAEPPQVVHKLTLDGLCIGLTHGHAAATTQDLLATCDIVCRGHSHLRQHEMVNGVRLINPGALGGKKPQSRSVCLLDTADGALTFVEIPD